VYGVACLSSNRANCARHGLTQQLPGIEGNYGRGLNPTEVLIPQVLRQAGYVTGCFGKWNIGFARGSRPTERGFDEFFGHASGNMDYYTHNYNQKHDLYRGIEEAHVDGYASDLFADAAIEFIAKNRRSPWFVYLPFNAPHYPNARNKAPGEENIWQAPDAALEAYGYASSTRNEQHRYHAVVTALDTALGRVLKTLDRLELRENTFVFFYSDNGAFMLKKRGLEVASNAPLRDGGVTCWEGGLRVAALVRWPGRIKPGTTNAESLWSPDLMVACAQLAGVQLPTATVLDGRDPLPVLAENVASPHRSLFFEYGRHAALRMGDWKIVRAKSNEDWQLFNLADDIGEQADVSKQQPEKQAALVAEFQRWKQSLE
jgi:arylsulfatase A